MSLHHLRSQLAAIRRSIPAARLCLTGPSRLALVLREAIATGTIPPRGTHVPQPSDYVDRIATELRARIQAESAVQS